MNVEKAVPFFMVENMESSLRYYVDGLGFEMKYKWIDEGKLRWCWLDHGGASVMLQEYRDAPKVKRGEGISVCFICKDAIAFYKEVKERGVNVQRPFVGNAMWVTSTQDPDGYRLEFESYTDAPEESEYEGP